MQKRRQIKRRVEEDAKEASRKAARRKWPIYDKDAANVQNSTIASMASILPRGLPEEASDLNLDTCMAVNDQVAVFLGYVPSPIQSAC